MVPRKLVAEKMTELQQLLLKHDAYIPGITNEDPADLGRKAEVSASTEYVDPVSGYVFSASRVVEGTSRGRIGDENLWMSKPFTRFHEAYIDLTWDRPARFNCVHLTFDTMMREQRMFDRFVMGAMSTCVKNYTLSVLDSGGNWRKAAAVSGNFLRHNVVRFSSVATSSLKIQVEQTNGDELARIYEVRVYNETDD